MRIMQIQFISVALVKKYIGGVDCEESCLNCASPTAKLDMLHIFQRAADFYHHEWQHLSASTQLLTTYDQACISYI